MQSGCNMTYITTNDFQLFKVYLKFLCLILNNLHGAVMPSKPKSPHFFQKSCTHIHVLSTRLPNKHTLWQQVTKSHIVQITLIPFKCNCLQCFDTIGKSI